MWPSSAAASYEENTFTLFFWILNWVCWTGRYLMVLMLLGFLLMNVTNLTVKSKKHLTDSFEAGSDFNTDCLASHNTL